MSVLFAAGVGLSCLFYHVDKSMKMDSEAMRKNAMAAIEMADAESRVAVSSRKLTEAIKINVSRKNGILTGHFKLFLRQSKKLKRIMILKKGRGIEELERISEIQERYKTYIKMPAVSSGRIVTDSQLLVSFALRGFGGTMVHDSQVNLEMAKKNLSKANALSAQVDSECIAMDAITEHIRIVTELLEKLGMVYMKSIRNITDIIKKNRWRRRKYSDEDLEAINLAFMLTKIIYRIINTPLVDENGEIEQEALNVINEGTLLLNSVM